MRLLQSPISITDTQTLIRSLQCAAQRHAAARSVNTRPDSSGSIPVTSFFVGTVVYCRYCRYCWYVTLWCLFWNLGFESDSLLIWFPVLNFVILPLCFVCIASSFNFFQSGETKFSFFLLFWGFVPSAVNVVVYLGHFSLSERVKVSSSVLEWILCTVYWSSRSLWRCPSFLGLVSLQTHTYLSKDLGLTPKQLLLSL